MITPLPGLVPLVDSAKAHYKEPQRLKKFRAYDTGEFFFNPSRKGEAYYWVVNALAPKQPMHPLWVRTFPNAKLPPHVDEHKRLCAINLPIIGDWDRSKLLMYLDDDKNGRVKEYLFGPPVLLDTSRLHSVDNRNACERVVLSIGFYKTNYEQTLELIRQGALFGKYPFDVTQTEVPEDHG